jgi:hypothetical protein
MDRKELGSYQGTTIYEGDDIAKIMADINSGKTSQAIPANDIKATTPVSVPNVQTQSSGQTIDQITAEVNAQKLKAEKASDQSKQTLEQRVKEITSVMGSRESLEKEAGLDQAQLDVSDIRSQIEGREMALRRAIENTQKTAGLSGTQIARQVSALNRDAARELADLSIIESARLRRFDSISTNIDRKIKSQLEPLQFQLQFDQMFYQENRQAMTAAQDRAFQMKIAVEERNHQEQVKERDSIKNIAISAAQAGATGEQITKITDAKTFNEAMNVGGSFLGEPFRQQMAAQKFQQEMSIKTYDLQVRGQAFSENMARQSLALQSQQLEESILARIQENNLKANEAFAKTEEAQAMTVVKGQVGSLNRLLENTVGSSDRDTLDWDRASKDMSVVRAIANAEARALNPDLTRAMAAGDLNAETSLIEIADRLFDKYIKGNNVRAVDLQNAVRSVDSAYQSRLNDANSALQRIETIYPSSQIITAYNKTAPAPIRTQIEDSLRQGYAPESILEEVAKNPLFTDSIGQALSQGYTPLSILNFLKTQ